jgi:hypothetical protein
MGDDFLNQFQGGGVDTKVIRWNLKPACGF